MQFKEVIFVMGFILLTLQVRFCNLMRTYFKFSCNNNTVISYISQVLEAGKADKKVTKKKPAFNDVQFVNDKV